MRADRRAEWWVPAFEQDWARALDDARRSYSLTPPARRRPRLAAGRRGTVMVTMRCSYCGHCSRASASRWSAFAQSA
ncbi:hypothetical protein [Streptomyces sp. NPDC050585]|uniref:hypothetical protein n=1 Tax=Streptomyces sp. NPDC050585 TaxID=3365632 RepID=UPI0037B67501